MKHHQIAELSDQFFFIRLDLDLHLLAASLRHDSLRFPLVTLPQSLKPPHQELGLSFCRSEAFLDGRCSFRALWPQAD